MKVLITAMILFICGLLFVHPVHSQSSNCSCNEHALTTWGDFVGADRCVGRCDNAATIRSRYCHVFNAIGQFQRTETCMTAQRSNCGECAGEWSSWGNTGRCSGRCGHGIQIQHRTCYRKNTPGRNIRVNECEGGGTLYDQSRNLTCRRRGSHCEDTTSAPRPTPRPQPTTRSTTTIPNASTTTTASSPKTMTTTIQPPLSTTAPPPSITITTTTTATTTTTEPPSTTTQLPKTTSPTTQRNKFASSVAAEDLEKDDDDESPSNFEDHVKPTLLSPGGFDTVTLAAVLGSVAIICVTIVAIAVAIVVVKKHEIKKNRALNLSTSSSSTNFVKQGSHVRRNDFNYNAMEYALPSETSPYGQVANPLYETTLMNGEPITTAVPVVPPVPKFSQQRRISNNNMKKNYELEAVYFSVDDHNR